MKNLMMLCLALALVMGCSDDDDTGGKLDSGMLDRGQKDISVADQSPDACSPVEKVSCTCVAGTAGSTYNCTLCADLPDCGDFFCKIAGWPQTKCLNATCTCSK